MTRPLLLDLFCGAGGCSEGYRRAGIDVVGVDINPQPRYRFPFVQGDALEALSDLIAGDEITTLYGADYRVSEFSAIHASPCCQRYSEATPKALRENHPDLVGPVRLLLEQTDIPWVIENVPGSPLRADVILRGGQFGLDVDRERWFECSWPVFGLLPSPLHDGVILNTMRSNHGPFVRKHGRVPTRAEIGLAMGIDWMRGDEIKQAIPPAYTEWIGRQLLEHLGVRA